jgi:hypothetical protein
MLFEVDPTMYTHCGQIQIRKVMRTPHVKIDLERVLHSFQSRFGRIVRLIMVNGSRSRDRT